MEMRKLSEPSALARTVKQLGISDYDAVRLAHGLVCETVRRKNLIDAYVNTVIRPETIDEFDLGVQAFMRLYVYQTRLAKNWAGCDIKEAENITKLGRSILGWKTLQKAEPVLGSLLTQKPGVLLENKSDEERIGLLTFHPTWFVKYCFRLFGRKETINMMEADAQAPITYIRLNTFKAAENEILKKLVEEGTRVEKVEQLRHTYKVLATKRPLTQTASFREGLFYIQEKESCLVVEAANPKPMMTVLDICAAPGAKTTYLAELMQNQGVIYSIDYSKRRMAVWKNETARMSAEIAEPIIADARIDLPFTIEADIIVLDPPCTSTGTFRKSPWDKWRLTPNSIDKMAAIQWQMMNNCAANVKPGGVLIYTTCSITVEENEIIIERFLKRSPEFALADIRPKIGLPGLRGLDRCQRLYPHIHQCNGFFIARLLKTRS
jgi:16S rRNA (cytosine967-C5)-methyltransferase